MAKAWVDNQKGCHVLTFKVRTMRVAQIFLVLCLELKNLNFLRPQFYDLISFKIWWHNNAVKSTSMAGKLHANSENKKPFTIGRAKFGRLKSYFQALFMLHLYNQSPIYLENWFWLDLDTESSMLKFYRTERCGCDTHFFLRHRRIDIPYTIPSIQLQHWLLCV